jgi:nicotinate-nucleotide adenylyltransferase
MQFFRRAAGRPARLGILPGTFNPVTIAHVALARAALETVGEVVFVLPRAFPHKEYSGASFTDRVEMLRLAADSEPAFSVAAAGGGGLFVEIAEECRADYGPDVRLTFLCGRDAAERIVEWDYGRFGAVAEMLAGFDLLVAERGGGYEPPPGLRAAVSCLNVGREVDSVSATEVRRRIAHGEPWEHLVPEAVRDRVREIYG